MTDVLVGIMQGAECGNFVQRCIDAVLKDQSMVVGASAEFHGRKAVFAKETGVPGKNR